MLWRRGCVHGRGQGGLGGLSPPTIEISPPPKHDGPSSATYELPQKIFACWPFSHSLDYKKRYD